MRTKAYILVPRFPLLRFLLPRFPLPPFPVLLAFFTPDRVFHSRVFSRPDETTRTVNKRQEKNKHKINRRNLKKNLKKTSEN